MSGFWEIVFCVPLRFRRHVCLSKLKHLPSRESPLTARKTVFSHLKYVDLPRHVWDTPPILLIVSPTPPVQSVDAYVRTYVRTLGQSRDNQTKRLTIFHEYGALSHARFAHAGVSLLITIFTKNWMKFYIQIFSFRLASTSRFLLSSGCFYYLISREDNYSLVISYLSSLFFRWFKMCHWSCLNRWFLG